MTNNKQLIYKDDARKAILNANPASAYCIDNIKPVDAVEVVHGRWERSKNNKIVCSICKNEPLLDDFGHWDMSTYCPNCGAKMDGDGNG